MLLDVFRYDRSPNELRQVAAKLMPDAALESCQNWAPIIAWESCQNCSAKSMPDAAWKAAKTGHQSATVPTAARSGVLECERLFFRFLSFLISEF